MGIRETKTYICDRCGKYSDRIDFKEDGESGHLLIKCSGKEGAQTAMGWSVGVINETEKLICHACLSEFKDFMRNRKILEIYSDNNDNIYVKKNAETGFMVRLTDGTRHDGTTVGDFKLIRKIEA